MNDQAIKELLFSRKEAGLEELDKAYGMLCRRLARNILGDEQEAEECVNDAYLAVWNRVPPVDPESLSAYLCQVVRNLSLKRLRNNSARKRNSAHDISIDELAADIPDFFDVEEEVLKNELADEISSFIRELSPESRYLFMQRYWYDESLEVIAKAIKRNKHYVSVRLSRIRKSLKNYLSDKGVCI